MNFPDAIPVLRDGASPELHESVGTWPYLVVIVLLLGVVVAIFRARGLHRKSGKASRKPSSPSGSMPAWWPWRNDGGLVVRHQARLTTKHSVHEVCWQGQTLLIGCADNTISVLAKASGSSPLVGDAAENFSPGKAAAVPTEQA